MSVMYLLLSVVSAVGPVVPVPGPLLEGFRAPACQRCAGRRGVVIGSRPGDVVRAVRSGPLTFVGQVGGLLYVVQNISPGVRVTYGWLASTTSSVAGDQISAGHVVGTASKRTYLGVRIGQTPVEPLRYLGLGGARLIGPGTAIVGQGHPSR
jgi:murein DD-endopeptidase MepM/ murein hydrolase activator NlpD